MSTGQLIQVLPGTGYTNVYTTSSIVLGTKLLLQNLTSSDLFVCLHATAQEQGFVIRPFEHYVVPAGVLGCFVKTTTGRGGTLAVEMGAWNVIGGSIDERVYTGYKGLTIQPFIESNVKNGTQWEYSFENAAVAAGANLDTLLTTGNQYVLVKNRQVTYNGSGMEATVFKGATYTGGSTIPIYNLNTGIATPCLATARSGITITATGDQAGAKAFSYGVQDVGNRATGTYTVTGLERVLVPNTTYLLRVTNTDTVSRKINVYVTFYEGEISSLN